MARFAPSCCIFAVTAWAVAGFAQSPAPEATPSPQPGQTVMTQPVAPSGPAGPVRAGFRPTSGAASTRTYEGSLKGVRAIQIGDGEARLVLGGGELVVTPGTVIGTDTVKSISPGRIVLRRVASDDEGGEGIVIVSFDSQGRTRVQVFAPKDPTARFPRDVK
jgi:hypothetical protein